MNEKVMCRMCLILKRNIKSAKRFERERNTDRYFLICQNSFSSSVCLQLQDGKVSSILMVEWSFFMKLHSASLCSWLRGLRTLNTIPVTDLMCLLLQLCLKAAFGFKTGCKAGTEEPQANTWSWLPPQYTELGRGERAFHFHGGHTFYNLRIRHSPNQ